MYELPVAADKRGSVWGLDDFARSRDVMKEVIGSFSQNFNLRLRSETMPLSTRSVTEHSTDGRL